MPRWLQILLALLLGLVIGLFYGWRVAPVEYVDLAPNTLRADYRADYVLMTAEAYQKEGNLNLAARRLALLGSAHPAEMIEASLSSESSGYTQKQTKLLEDFLREMRAWQPSLAEEMP